MLLNWLFSRDQTTAGAPLSGNQVDPQDFLKQEKDFFIIIIVSYFVLF